MIKTVRTMFACLLLLAVVTPALADDHEDAEDGGFFVAVEGKFLEASGLDTGYVLVDPNDDSVPDGSIRNVDLSAAPSYKLWVGQSRGKSGWAVAYWTFDEDENDSVSAPLGGTGELWDIPYHADDALEDYQGDASADLSIEADTIDVVYWREVLANDDFRLGWFGGFRMATLDTRLDMLFTEDEGGGLVDDRAISLMTENEAFGLVGGLNGSVSLTKRLKWSTSLGYSFLMADRDNATMMIDQPSTTPDFDANVARETDGVMTIVELSTSLNWYISENWMVNVGYELSNWQNATDRDLFPDDVNEGFIQQDTSDVSFHGFHVGVGVMF